MPTTVSKDELEQFVELVNSYRERTGVSISELARVSEVRRPMLSELLSGTYAHSPTFDIINKIAKACSIRIAFEPETDAR